uniref:Uncharacterized protein n=1 Tax=Tetranychus urticae TaxID=32264 RepID=T1KSK6_TETUR
MLSQRFSDIPQRQLLREIQASRLNWFSIKGIVNRIGVSISFIDSAGAQIRDPVALRRSVKTLLRQIPFPHLKLRYINKLQVQSDRSFTCHC